MTTPMPHAANISFKGQRQPVGYYDGYYDDNHSENLARLAPSLENACHHFAKIAAPYLYITDDEHYNQVLTSIEALLEKASDSPADPLNAIIEMLTGAVEAYENKEDELAAFEKRATDGAADLAMVRLLMDQRDLSMDDLPEIGSKSMVSRVLSGERNLSKKHIQALSARFGIDPGMFF
uniref:HTH-type transcriptional regulator / antitoxin HigA n=1 Tax=Candidatus Kentrum sp. MB TaxID=2138164 RepID=A0A450X736_9GAMM|nr:MAG: HTH-type transcriptional regulator / antitoxin HigA [Candidatus Kentron sp. MB]VFK29868.1 MAG: HTH-type transcriptional regulator / antitoxin HigA [Candidatus Kentron sp. MB]VFK74977.1 MAG: HTH-type transcriptional regulator / antitoxin HigA [Candidatus Kentron sp. MB]